MNQPIRVFIVDNNLLFTEAVAAILDAREEIVLVGLAANLDGMLEKAPSDAIDVVLINTSIEQMDTAQLIQNIKEELPDVKVIVVGLSYREDDNLKFIEAGASGYVFKEGSIADLLRTIELVHCGQTPCSPKMAALVFTRIAELSQELGQGEKLQQAELTRREKEILQFIVKGFSNKKIAHHLHIKLYTVKNHVHNILEKLQVHRRQGAIRYAHENGMFKGFQFLRLFLGNTSSSKLGQGKAEGLEKVNPVISTFLNRKIY